MRIYLDGPDAVSDLHIKGFTNDFQLLGNDLFWVQENILIMAGEFSILEYHKITKPERSMDELVVFGIVAPYYNIKGILVGHYKRHTSIIPPVLVKKLIELSIHAGINRDE